MDSELLIIDELDKIFPDKKYKNVSEIKEKNKYLDNQIVTIAKEKGLTAERYILSLGFRPDKLIYDNKTITNLIANYNINDTDLAKLVNKPKQQINQLKSKSTKYDDLWLAQLSESEEHEIINLIKNDCFEIVNVNEISFKILAQKYDKTRAIFYRKNNDVKVIINIPTAIIDEMEKKRLDIFLPEHLDYNKVLEKKWILQGSKLSFSNTKIVKVNNSFKNKFDKSAKKIGLSRDEYLKKIKFEFFDGRKTPDGDILARIEKYADENKNIKIKTEDKDYTYFMSRRARYGFKSIVDFFKEYGFNYTLGRKDEYLLDKYVSIIEKYYIVEGSTIYISSYDPFCKRLRGFANNNNIEFDEFITDLGYVRISHINDLPNGYIPYDYKKQTIEFDEIIEHLLKISDEDKKIYIDVKSYFYYKLYLFSKSQKKTINEFLTENGFKRVYKGFNTINNDVFDDLIKESEEYQQEILDKLNSLQTKYVDANIDIKDKAKRNENLINLMKKLYHFNCQLCNEDNGHIPPIEKQNGELYVEVHHITSFSSADETNIEIIDNFKNAVVVCPHHHKVLHYQNGGFNKIIKENNEMFFIDKMNNHLKIKPNIHLES